MVLNSSGVVSAWERRATDDRSSVSRPRSAVIGRCVAATCRLPSGGPGHVRSDWNFVINTDDFCAGHRRIERSAHRGEEQDCSDARADLEAPVGDVTVRHPIADDVEKQSERQRAEPRTDERTAGGTGRNVKRGDQAASLASRWPGRESADFRRFCRVL